MRTLDDKLRAHFQVVDTKLEEGEVVLLHLSRELQEQFDVDADQITPTGAFLIS